MNIMVMEERQLTKKERKAQKRLEREQKREHDQKKGKIKKAAVWACIALAAAGLIALFILPSGNEQALGADFSKEMPIEGSEHVAEGTDISYQSNPPTSGRHWPAPLRDGVYDKEKPDQAVVHSLEHGRIWISYKPSIPEEAKQALLELARSRSLVILTPREKNETDIALVGWQRLDAFNLDGAAAFDQKRIFDFISRYANKGPERVVGDHGTKTYE